MSNRARAAIAWADVKLSSLLLLPSLVVVVASSLLSLLLRGWRRLLTSTARVTAGNVS